MKKVSVIVPIYKVEQYLNRCVESLTNQSYRNLEIILVDDGSPDNCPQICDDWVQRDNRIVVVHKINGGVSSARNTGIENATGEYISFIDPDDIIHPNYYDIMMSHIVDSDCIICNYEKFTDEIKFENTYTINAELLNSKQAIKKGFNKNFNIFYVVWNKIIKANIVKKCRFDESMKNGEDSVFAFDIINSCNKISYIDFALYGYYIRKDGAVKKIDPVGKMNIAKMAVHICTPYMHDVDKNIKSRSRTIFSHILYSTMLEFKNSGEEAYYRELKSILKKNKKAIISSENLSLKEKAFSIIEIMR